MASPKFLQYYQEMVNQNYTLFKRFREIHKRYIEDPKKNKEAFDEIGAQVLELARGYEARLTAHSIGSGYAKYSTTLSELFWGTLKKDFPKIDFVGVK